MDGEGADMTWESSSTSSAWNIEHDHYEAITSRGGSSVELDERLRDIVDGSPCSDQHIDGSTEPAGGDNEDEADPHDQALFDPACFKFDSESDDESNPLADTLNEEEEEEEDSEQECNDVPPALLELVQILLLWSTIYKVSDNAMSILFKSLRIALGKFETSEIIAKSTTMFPTTVKGCMKLLQATANEFGIKLPDPKGMVVCPKCFSVHDIQWQGSIPTYRKCVHRPSPNHPHRMRRAGCQSDLFREMPTGRLVPEKLFPYIPLEPTLQNILARPGILDLCSDWKYRISPDNDGHERLLRDIFDGEVFRVQAADQADVSESLPLFLALNVDWFQPFTHTQYSVGAMYLSIANLPRDCRFRTENILLLGVIPGPKEPRLHINPFLNSFVEELKSFLTGITMVINGAVIKVRALLNLVVCDIPGCRKVLALPGHSARFGCSKCLCEFEVEQFGDKPDYSGFDRSHWPVRCRDDHYAHAMQYATATSKAQQKKIASEYGVRYCELLQLPYFDLIRHHVIDPMHNLFEGTAKRFMELLTFHKLLDMVQVEKRVAMVIPPTPAGRIPRKVETKFSGFSADQWRSWVLIYSPIVLMDIDSSLYTCWMHFVQACCLLSSRAITVANVNKADRHLSAFCCRLQAFFGPEACSINMHMHLHLRQCLLDYGPIYGFWCFPYERYNGKLGDYATNGKGIEMQVARKFLREQYLRSLPVPEDYRVLLSVDPNTGFKALPTTGAAITTAQYRLINYCKTIICPTPEVCFALPDQAGCFELVAATSKVLRVDELLGLKCMYTLLYGDTFTAGITFTANFADCSNCVNIGGLTLKKGQMVSAHWPPNDPQLPERCGLVHCFLIHEVCLSDTLGSIRHILAEVHWYDTIATNLSVSPLIAASYTVDFGMCQFVPVQRLTGNCAHATLNLPQLHNGEIVIANPISFNYSVC